MVVLFGAPRWYIGAMVGWVDPCLLKGSVIGFVRADGGIEGSGIRFVGAVELVPWWYRCGSDWGLYL